MNWLQGLWARFDSWRYGRWLKTPDGQAYMLAMSFLAEHAQYSTLHELSPDTYARWNSPEEPPGDRPWSATGVSQ